MVLGPSTTGPCLLPFSQGEETSAWGCQRSFSAYDSAQAASRGADALLALPVPSLIASECSPACLQEAERRGTGVWCERGREIHMADDIQLKILR